MKDVIKVNLSTDHFYECATDVIGREGEGNVTQLEIDIPVSLLTCHIYLDFTKPNGETLRTPELEVINGVARYTVVPYLLTDAGEIKVQIVVTTSDGVTWKSSTKTYYNLHSVNAEDFINNHPQREDFFTQAQRVLSDLSQEVGQIATILSSNTAFADAVIERVEGLAIEELDMLKEDVDKIDENLGALSDLVSGMMEEEKIPLVYSYTTPTATSELIPLDSTKFETNGVYLVEFVVSEDKGTGGSHTGILTIKNDAITNNYDFCSWYVSLGQFRLHIYRDYTCRFYFAYDELSYATVYGTLNFYKIGTI